MARSTGTDTAEAAVLSRGEAIIGALALAAGALIAQKPETAAAANNQPVLVGSSYTSLSSTFITRMFDGGLFSPAYSAGGLTTNDGPTHFGIDGQTLAGGPGSAGVYGAH